MSTDLPFSTAQIWRARQRIAPYIRRTPLHYSAPFSQRLGAPVYFKMECWQVCGCFKVRGTVNMVASLSAKERASGLVTTSSGNHGIALAYASSLFGHPPVTVFLPQDSDPTKIAKLQATGARTEFCGRTYAEAFEQAQVFVRETGATYVHSHNHPWIIAGQGTIGLEVLEDLAGVETIVVPIGGGGLVAGITAAVKDFAPDVQIVGVEPAAAPGAWMSLRDGVAHEQIQTQPSIADGLLGGFGSLPFQITRDRLTRVELVEDCEILPALDFLQSDEQLIVEPAAAIGLAAALAGKISLHGRRTVFILTSRNVDAVKYRRLIEQQQREEHQ